MSDTVLVINAGSSSIKFQLFDTDAAGDLSRRIIGKIDGVGTMPRLVARDGKGANLIDRSWPAAEVPTVEAAQDILGDWLRGRLTDDPVAVGHRVVHGGPDYAAPLLVDDVVLARLAELEPLAPLHQPHNLAAIRAVRRRRSDLPQVACFDTAFHRGHGPLADRFAIPERFHAAGIRRYGFHGLSYEYVAGRLAAVAPELAKGRVVIAHLGSGCSMCAVHEGRSIDSTMGFTALDGLPMGTRPGALDAGVVLHLIERAGMTPAEVERLLYHDCGLKGLSGISGDVRELLASDTPAARLALDFFVWRVAKELGALAAALGGLDALVFTAGIGENSPEMRARIVERAAWLGARLDPVANAGAADTISAPGSSFPILVVPTDEELMIARHTIGLVRGRAAPGS